MLVLGETTSARRSTWRVHRGDGARPSRRSHAGTSRCRSARSSPSRRGGLGFGPDARPSRRRGAGHLPQGGRRRPRQPRPRPRSASGRRPAPRRDDRAARRGPERVAGHGDPDGGGVRRRDEAPRPARTAGTSRSSARVSRAARTRVAMREVLPDAELRVWSRNQDHAEALALEAHGLLARRSTRRSRRRRRLHLHRVSRAHRASADWLRAHTSTPSARRGHPRESSRRTSSPTRRSSSTGASRRVNESGDYLRAVDEAGIGPDHILAELGELLVGAHPGPTRRRGADALQVARPRRRGPRRRCALRPACTRAGHGCRGAVLIPLEAIERARAITADYRRREPARPARRRRALRDLAEARVPSADRLVQAARGRRAPSARPDRARGEQVSGRRARGTWHRACVASRATSACPQRSSLPTTRRARSSTRSSGWAAA